MRKFYDTKGKIIFLSIVITMLAVVNVFGENLLKSPAFEDLNDWTVTDYNVAGTVETENGVMKIESAEDNHVYVWQNVPVESGEIYKFSAEIKAENVPDKENGALIGIYYKVAYSDEVRGTTDDFIPVELYFTTQKKNVPVMLSLGGYSCMTSGTAYFRNVSVEKVNEVPAGAYYYDYTDKPAEEKEFDNRWYLLVALLAIVVAGAITYVYNASEDSSEK